MKAAIKRLTAILALILMAASLLFLLPSCMDLYRSYGSETRIARDLMENLLSALKNKNEDAAAKLLSPQVKNACPNYKESIKEMIKQFNGDSWQYDIENVHESKLMGVQGNREIDFQCEVIVPGGKYRFDIEYWI